MPSTAQVRRMKRYLLVVAFLAAAAGGARAAPPPPPPGYVYSASRVLAGAMAPTEIAALAPRFSKDVKVYENGDLVADGEAAWLSLARRKLAAPQRRVIGLAQSSGGYSKDGGELLVVDVVDSVDRAALPPGSIADPRLTTRSFLYQFGADGLIHVVRIARAGGFWEPIK